MRQGYKSVFRQGAQRHYATSSGAITLIIYDDRMEIVNTGLLTAKIRLRMVRI